LLRLFRLFRLPNGGNRRALPKSNGGEEPGAGCAAPTEIKTHAPNDLTNA
jgi:hypothetical protein